MPLRCPRRAVATADQRNRLVISSVHHAPVRVRLKGLALSRSIEAFPASQNFPTLERLRDWWRSTNEVLTGTLQSASLRLLDMERFLIAERSGLDALRTALRLPGLRTALLLLVDRLSGLHTSRHFPFDSCFLQHQYVLSSHGNIAVCSPVTAFTRLTTVIPLFRSTAARFCGLPWCGASSPGICSCSRCALHKKQASSCRRFRFMSDMPSSQGHGTNPLARE